MRFKDTIQTRQAHNDW